MPRPIKHRELIRRLGRFGWEGPFQKGKHPFMVREGCRGAIKTGQLCAIKTGIIHWAYCQW